VDGGGIATSLAAGRASSSVGIGGADARANLSWPAGAVARLWRVATDTSRETGRCSAAYAAESVAASAKKGGTDGGPSRA